MRSTRNSLLFVLVGVLSFWVYLAVEADETPPSQASAQGDMNLERFKEEMALAKKAPERDSRVEHLRKALEYRPSDPDNIRIEWQIGVELSQRYDPKYAEQKPKPAEALAVFLGILERYKHADYYETDPSKEASAPFSSPLRMIPFAANQAAALEYVVNGDENRARELAFFAMDCLNETRNRRIVDWQNAPYPTEPDAATIEWLAGLHEDAVRDWKREVEKWQKRQKKAAEGDVLSRDEAITAWASIRSLRIVIAKYTAEEKAAIMDEVIRRYPNTPMAKFAAEEKESILQAPLEAQPLPSVPLPEPPTDGSWGVKASAPSAPTVAATAPDFGVKATATPVTADASAASLTPAEPSKQRSVADWLAPLLTGIIIAVAAALYIYTRRKS